MSAYSFTRPSTIPLPRLPVAHPLDRIGRVSPAALAECAGGVPEQAVQLLAYWRRRTVGTPPSFIRKTSAVGMTEVAWSLLLPVVIGGRHVPSP